MQFSSFSWYELVLNNQWLYRLSLYMERKNDTKTIRNSVVAYFERT